MSMIKDLISDLRDEAENPVHHDDEEFNAYDMSGVNYDDAYQLGVESGRSELARELLKTLEEGS